MAKLSAVAALVASFAFVILAGPVPTIPAPRSILSKRLEDGVDCVNSSVDAPADMFFCFDSEGYDMACEDCETASTDQGWVNVATLSQ